MRHHAIRVLLALVAHEDMEITQFDVKTAFLYEVLEKDVYMAIPQGVKVPNSVSDENVKNVKRYFVCKLEKSLYGLDCICFKSVELLVYTFSTLVL